MREIDVGGSLFQRHVQTGIMSHGCSFPVLVAAQYRPRCNTPNRAAASVVGELNPNHPICLEMLVARPFSRRFLRFRCSHTKYAQRLSKPPLVDLRQRISKRALSLAGQDSVPPLRFSERDLALYGRYFSEVFLPHGVN